MDINEAREILINRNEKLEQIEELLIDATGYGCTPYGKAILNNCLNQFTFEEVIDAIVISVNTYFFNEMNLEPEQAFTNMLRKIGGICRNRRNYQNEEDEAYGREKDAD